MSVMPSLPSHASIHRPTGAWRTAAFSLVEMLMMIAIIGVLVTVSITYWAPSSEVVPSVKLESDVATLNQMVALYIGD